MIAGGLTDEEGGRVEAPLSEGGFGSVRFSGISGEFNGPSWGHRGWRPGWAFSASVKVLAVVGESASAGISETLVLSGALSSVVEEVLD